MAYLLQKLNIVMAWPLRKKKWQKVRGACRSLTGLLQEAWAWVTKLAKQVSGEFQRQLLIAKMQRGDIVLASPKTSRLSPIALLYRIVLRSRYVHSMLYVGEGQIIHTTTQRGVVKDRLPRKIFRKENYAVYRVKNLSPEQRIAVTEAAEKWLHRKLDHAGLIANVPSRLVGLKRPILMFEKKRIWCSKLIYKSFMTVGVAIVPPERADSITSEDLSRNVHLQRV